MARHSSLQVRNEDRLVDKELRLSADKTTTILHLLLWFSSQPHWGTRPRDPWVSCWEPRPQIKMPNLLHSAVNQSNQKEFFPLSCGLHYKFIIHFTSVSIYLNGLNNKLWQGYPQAQWVQLQTDVYWPEETSNQLWSQKLFTPDPILQKVQVHYNLNRTVCCMS